ncbi:MAG: glycosyltransferase family 9 protein [Elusimicrobiota bacterium]|nr:glycosyltransferase family 9 protein [Elusimicrobiota bacterium]
MDFLIIRYSSLGDVILTTPVAENIMLDDASHKVDILTKPEYEQVFFNNPNIDDIKTGWPGRKRYDYIIDLHNSLRSNLIKHFIPSQEILIYDKAAYARRAYLYSGKYDNVLKKSVIDRYLEPLKKTGIAVKTRKPFINISEREESKARSFTGKKKYVLLAPGAKWFTKQWVEEYYISLMKKIIQERNLNVALAGDRTDIDLCARLVKGVGLLKSHVVNLAGRTGLRELFAVIKNAEAAVTTDSAPLHIGWAVGTEVVAIYGPTVKEFGFQPDDPKVHILQKDMECRPCSLHGSKKCKFKDRACMKRIEPHEVMGTLNAVLDESS